MEHTANIMKTNKGLISSLLKVFAMFYLLLIGNLYKPYEKKKFDLHYSDEYWPTSKKDTIKWFPFIAIMEQTENIMNINKGIIPSLLKVFAMFELRLIGDKDKLDSIAIRCINCKKGTVLYLKTSTFEEMITKCVLNKILHRVGIFWIISFNDEIKY